jgi:hypothetical protein
MKIGSFEIPFKRRIMTIQKQLKPLAKIQKRAPALLINSIIDP